MNWETMSTPPVMSTKMQVEKKGVGGSRKKDAIEALVSKPSNFIESSLSQLRYLILSNGLSLDSPYRAYVWAILLRVEATGCTPYLQTIKKGPSKVYLKIKDDTFRTLSGNQEFHTRVSENSLIRVLNGYANGSKGHYVQGMNVLVAPFLYVSKSESQAFALFQTFINRDCPLYIVPTMQGVHDGLTLLDHCLELIDPTLFDYLKSKMLTAKLYAFPSVLTFSACTPPLSEVLILWDFLFAYGAHVNILFVIAQLILTRDELLASKSPISVLRSFPQLRAKEIIKLGISFIPRIPAPLYELLARHMWDPKASEEIAEYKVNRVV